MKEFLQLLADPHADFLRLALAVGAVASIAFAVTGTFVVVRRSASIAGAIAHSVLGGIGAATWVQYAFGWAWCTPLLGALAAAILSALAIGIVTLSSSEREDTVINAIWATGMAVGLLFLHKVPGNVDAMSYLMGDILIVSKADLWIVVGLDLVVLVSAFLLYHKLAAVCFDEEFARLRGVRANAYYLYLLVLTSLSIVLLSRLVGIIMVIALIVIPAAIASPFSRRLWHMMLISAACCVVFITAGMGLSVQFDLPSGPVIILVAGVAYLVGHSIRRLAGR